MRFPVTPDQATALRELCAERNALQELIDRTMDSLHSKLMALQSMEAGVWDIISKAHDLDHEHFEYQLISDEDGDFVKAIKIESDRKGK